ncbi:hypothetical protein HK101_009140 [Irineochytrium annulatum]|nr:hypothetical protein HK101_009140 [Irineochytrium annulatum]
MSGRRNASRRGVLTMMMMDPVVRADPPESANGPSAPADGHDSSAAVQEFQGDQHAHEQTARLSGESSGEELPPTPQQQPSQISPPAATAATTQHVAHPNGVDSAGHAGASGVNAVAVASSSSTGGSQALFSEETLVALYAAFLAEFHPKDFIGSKKRPCNAGDHAGRIDNPPNVQGKSVGVYDFFAAVQELGGVKEVGVSIRKIQNWNALCRRLGFEGNTAGARIKDWCYAHHVNVFFDYLLGNKDEFSSAGARSSLKRRSDGTLQEDVEADEWVMEIVTGQPKKTKAFRLPGKRQRVDAMDTTRKSLVDSLRDGPPGSSEVGVASGSLQTGHRAAPVPEGQTAGKPSDDEDSDSSSSSESSGDSSSSSGESEDELEDETAPGVMMVGHAAMGGRTKLPPGRRPQTESKRQTDQMLTAQLRHQQELHIQQTQQQLIQQQQHPPGSQPQHQSPPLQHVQQPYNLLQSQHHQPPHPVPQHPQLPHQPQQYHHLPPGRPHADTAAMMHARPPIPMHTSPPTTAGYYPHQMAAMHYSPHGHLVQPSPLHPQQYSHPHAHPQGPYVVVTTGPPPPGSHIVVTSGPGLAPHQAVAMPTPPAQPLPPYTGAATQPLHNGTAGGAPAPLPHAARPIVPPAAVLPATATPAVVSGKQAKGSSLKIVNGQSVANRPATPSDSPARLATASASASPGRSPALAKKPRPAPTEPQSAFQPHAQHVATREAGLVDDGRRLVESARALPDAGAVAVAGRKRKADDGFGDEEGHGKRMRVDGDGGFGDARQEQYVVEEGDTQQEYDRVSVVSPPRRGGNGHSALSPKLARAEAAEITWKSADGRIDRMREHMGRLRELAFANQVYLGGAGEASAGGAPTGDGVKRGAITELLHSKYDVGPGRVGPSGRVHSDYGRRQFSDARGRTTDEVLMDSTFTAPPGWSEEERERRRIDAEKLKQFDLIKEENERLAAQVEQLTRLLESEEGTGRKKGKAAGKS